MATIRLEYHPNGYSVWVIYVGGVATICHRNVTDMMIACRDAGLEWVWEV